ENGINVAASYKKWIYLRYHGVDQGFTSINTFQTGKLSGDLLSLGRRHNNKDVARKHGAQCTIDRVLNALTQDQDEADSEYTDKESCQSSRRPETLPAHIAISQHNSGLPGAWSEHHYTIDKRRQQEDKRATQQDDTQAAQHD